MSTPHDIEAEVLDTVHSLLKAWAGQGSEALDRFLTYVADDFTGLGTGPGDYYENRDMLHTAMLREQEHLPYAFTLNVPWMQVRVLQPTLALAEGELQVKIQTEGDTPAVEPRCSMVLEQRDGQWLLLHFHFSVPDVMQNVGDTLSDALQARNRELEREVARRTAELNQSLADLKAAQAQLVQQEKMASLGALTAGIAHEIKNPLNFVNNFASLSRELVDELQEETDPEELEMLLRSLKTNAEKIEEHGRRADSIIRSMMQHARRGNGERTTVDLNTLVDKYLDLAYHGKRAQVPSFNVDIARDYGEDVGEIGIVEQDIGRVLLNLFDNAFDAVHERAASADETYAPSVQVTTRRLDDEVEIQVEDNGAGMSPDVQEHIFEPFFTTKPTGQGTGLGLSLSYDIITQGHSGTLIVDSTPGEGATFVITLPG